MPKLRCSNESCSNNNSSHPLFSVENATVLCNENLVVSLRELERSLEPRFWEDNDIRFICDHCLSYAEVEVEGEEDAEAA